MYVLIWIAILYVAKKLVFDMYGTGAWVHIAFKRGRLIISKYGIRWVRERGGAQ